MPPTTGCHRRRGIQSLGILESVNNIINISFQHFKYVFSTAVTQDVERGKGQPLIRGSAVPSQAPPVLTPNRDTQPQVAPDGCADSV